MLKFTDILDFGKYKGKTIDEVFLENCQYLSWCIKEVEGFKMSNKDAFIIAQKTLVQLEESQKEDENRPDVFWDHGQFYKD